ncbi:MAG: LamG domain-containing protein, partial [Desulfobacteria bacterium]
MKKARMFFCVVAGLGIIAGSVGAKPLGKGQRRGMKPESVVIADPYKEAVDGILNAIAEKQEALTRIDAAIEQEEAVAQALNSTKKSRGFDDLKPRDILKSAANVSRSAMRQKKIKRDLVKSIKDLKKSLDLLGWEGPMLPEPVAHCGFIVSFKSIEPFEPRTPKELLNSFTERHWQGARTHHFRTQIQGGKLTGHICVDNDADKKSLAVALERSDKLTLVKIRAVTQKEFEEHCRMGQPSLPPLANSIGMEFVLVPTGEWRAVDFVKEIEYFKPGKKQWTSDLYLKGLTFYKDGRTSGPWTWEKGWLWHPGDKTKARYIIKEIDGSSYLFMEWISGDVTIRRQKPRYYVMQKVVDNDTALISGLIAYWKFDEGEGNTAYDSTGDHDGVVHGAQWTMGRIGGAMSFDGRNDYVSVPNDDSLEGMSELTINMWVKPNSLGNYDCLIHKGDWGDGFVAHIGAGVNRNEDIWWGADAKKPGTRVCSNANLSIGEWQMVTLWFKGDHQWKIYKNATEIGSAIARVGAIPASADNIMIGHGFGSVFTYFDGAIDDVRIYNRALTVPEIKQLYGNLKIPNAAKGPVVYADGLAVDGIVVRQSHCTAEFVESLLGKPRKKDGSMLRYTDSGIDFCVPRNGSLSEIHLNRGFKGKLDTGISLTSTKQDVFRAYGEPVEIIRTANLHQAKGERVLRQNGNVSRIYYGNEGLIFWFRDDSVIQIVVF